MKRLLLFLPLLLAGLVLPATSQAVIHGQPAPFAEAPWAVRIYTGGDFSCTGSLVAPKLVVTAAHCLLDEDAENVSVGGASARVKLGNGWLQDAEKIEPHPRFGFIRGASFTSDVGVITLPEPAPAPSQVLPLIASPAAGGAKVTVFGWGATNSRGQIARSLRKLKLQTRSPGECQSRWPKREGPQYSQRTTICGGTDRRQSGPCFGDSGGPLVSADPAAPGLVAVVSGGPDPCITKRKPPLFARVDSGPLRAWLLSRITTANAT